MPRFPYPLICLITHDRNKKDFAAPDHRVLKEATLVRSFRNHLLIFILRLLARRRPGKDRAARRGERRAALSEKSLYGQKRYEDALSSFRAARLRFL